MGISEPENVCVLTDEQLEILKEREEKYLQGENKTQTLEEFKKKISEKYGFTLSY